MIKLNRVLLIFLAILMILACVCHVCAEDLLSSSSDGGSGAFNSEDNAGDGDGAFTSKDSDINAPDDDDYVAEDNDDESSHVNLSKHATGIPLILLFVCLIPMFLFKR